MTSKDHYSPHQLAYFSHQLTLRAASDSMDSMAGALMDAQVDLNQHQIDAALFATSKPWRYVLIPHTAIAVNMTVDGLARQFGC